MNDQAAPRPSIDTVIDQIEIDLSHYNPAPRWCEMHTGRALALVDHIRTLEATVATLRRELDAADTSIATLLGCRLYRIPGREGSPSAAHWRPNESLLLAERHHDLYR